MSYELGKGPRDIGSVDVPALFVEILILFKAIERDEVTVAVAKFRANFHRALKCEVSNTYFQNCSY